MLMMLRQGPLGLKPRPADAHDAASGPFWPKSLGLKPRPTAQGQLMLMILVVRALLANSPGQLMLVMPSRPKAQAN